MQLFPLLFSLLLTSTPGSWARNVRRQSDTWGTWGEWSPCSRTCGGGISFRERPCYSQRRDGGTSCVGPARSHRTCHTESCPDGVRDFRAEQCAEFDGTDFQGRRYRWLPYYAAPNKCELNCIPKGQNFYYKHKDAVVDGTPCEPGQRDICVDGVCRVVGCDHKLDSIKQEDKCLQCGGDGSSCYPVTGTFDGNDLSRGYNQIFIIPAGATSIRIEEAAASRNFLAVKSIRGEYYLNGHWTIEAAQALPVASTVLQYERGVEGDLAPERLQARGPTSEPLVIELLSQESNPGVHYEYYLPANDRHQSRLVFCTIDNEAYPDHMCQHQPRPTHRRSCNTQPCPKTKRWKVGPWTPCSVSCGGGVQSRSVYCISSDGTGGQEAAEETQCAGLVGKPPTTQACNLQHCAVWSVEPWGECSVTCGTGIRKRSVTCRGDEGSPVHAAACLLKDQPTLTEPCVQEACPVFRGQAWHVGSWSLCSKSCGSGIRRRQVVCTIGPPGRCVDLQSSKPAEMEACNRQPCHLPQEVPSIQDPRTRSSDPRMLSGPRVSPVSDGREQQWAPLERPRAQSNPREGQDPNLSSAGRAPTLQRPPHQPPLRPSSGPRDCRHSPHGCCPDGHTPSLGPQWQGCPLAGASCLQSRYGCCPDGVSAAEGPQQAGCTRSHGSDNTGNRPGSRAVASKNPKIHQPQAHEGEPSECRSSRFGCCYDNVASAAGPLGEGCVGQPSYAYPVRCLLPSAQGSCGDWAARWYFVASVGRCNRFWYGGCHGNANNFASEQECMNTCRGQHGPRRPEAGAAGHRAHVDGGQRGPGGQQEPDWHRAGATIPRLPSPSGSPWRREQEPAPGEPPHIPAYGNRPGGQEIRPRVPGLDREARPAVPPTHSPSYRIRLAGSEPSLVQAAPGQAVQLFCPGNIPSEFQAGWQKEGRPISSNRYQLQADGSLIISRLRPEDAGIYSCGSHRPGHEPQEIQLRVTGTQTLAMVLRTVEQEQKRGATGSSLPHTPGLPPGNTTACTNSPGLSWSTVSIGEEGRLRLDRTQPGVVDASPGQRIRLTCRAEGFPVPTIEWQRDGQLVSSPRHQVQPDGSLVISRVDVEDGGYYSCVAFNGQDRDQRWVQLRVLRELTITGLPPAVTVAEGDTARLLCVVAGESVNIRWSRNGLPIQADGHRVHQSPDGTLLIHNLRPRDEGSYTCSAFRGSQAVSRSTEVKVALPAPAAQSRDLGKDCIDQPELANCALILQAQLCGNEYYSSFCCASCSRFQPNAQPVWQQG
ncbi:papilin, proteoglycan-like sulfated glycoprotein [Mus musculus]|nr:papilin, proteoglycan-like sulfated glycoprotein [Mus musculus]